MSRNRYLVDVKSSSGKGDLSTKKIKCKTSLIRETTPYVLGATHFCTVLIIKKQRKNSLTLYYEE